MLALIKDNVFVSEVVENSRHDVDDLVIMPASEGWLYRASVNTAAPDAEPVYVPTGPTYALVTIKDATQVPQGKMVVSKNVKLVAGLWQYVNVLADIPVLSPEELRAQMPRKSMVELRAALRGIRTETVTEGIYAADINRLIDAIADLDLQEQARDYFNLGQYAERINPWVDILGAGFGITPEQIDTFWNSTTS